MREQRSEKALRMRKVLREGTYADYAEQFKILGRMKPFYKKDVMPKNSIVRGILSATAML